MKIVSVSDAATRAPNDAARTTLRIENGAAAAPAAADESQTDRRGALERELDRLQQAIQIDQQAGGQHLNWLMLSQALFMNAFLIVLVLGGSVPLVFARWLLVGLAALGMIAAVVLYGALRRASDEVAMLRIQRRAVEISLQKEFGRVPMFPSSRSEAPSTALPTVFLAAWLVLVAYAFFVPR